MSLWDWALATYAYPGVAEACLDLQDRHGQNVPFLLWAAWAQSSDPAMLRAAADAARGWDAVAVAPLRATRRKLVLPVPPIGDEAREALRETVREAEFAAERLLMETLEARTGERRGGISTLESLRGAALAWGRTAPDDALHQLAAAIDVGLPSQGEALHDRGFGSRSQAYMDKQDDAEWERDLRARLVAMTQDHADLDAAIQALAASALPDMLVIGRLKRKKLALKDEIARLQDQLTPDIIA
jgi:uncharacterized protein (TIGR02444 family)